MYFEFITLISLVNLNEKQMFMAHCPNCGDKCSNLRRVLKNHYFAIKPTNAKKCDHNFNVTISESDYTHNPP